MTAAKPTHANVRAEVERDGKVRRNHAGRDAGQPERSAEPEHRATEREQEALGEQLLHQPRATRAERQANADLLTATRRAGQEQVRDVRARDEQHDRNECEHAPRDDRHHLPRLFLDAARRERTEIEARESRRVAAAKLRGQRVDLGGGRDRATRRA